jgi:hypothetical protein
MGRKKTGFEWGKDALRDADFSKIVHQQDVILEGIGQEAVDVYLFLTEHFAHGLITENNVFQFVYRSYYMLDGAGLMREFKKKYFELMEASRGQLVDIRFLAETLYEMPNAKGQKTVQFSFVTKLAHTVDHNKALYDINVADYFHGPYNNLSGFDGRIKPLLDFYNDLGVCYERILADGSLATVMRRFKRMYSERVPDIKILDFIFHSAGRLGLSVERFHNPRASKIVITNTVELIAKG